MPKENITESTYQNQDNFVKQNNNKRSPDINSSK